MVFTKTTFNNIYYNKFEYYNKCDKCAKNANKSNHNHHYDDCDYDDVNIEIISLVG
jgi:hypothetical protein